MPNVQQRPRNEPMQSISNNDYRNRQPSSQQRVATLVAIRIIAHLAEDIRMLTKDNCPQTFTEIMTTTPHKTIKIDCLTGTMPQQTAAN